MKLGSTKRWIYRWSSRAEVAAGTVLAVLGPLSGLSFIEAATKWPWLAPLFRLLDQWAMLILLISAVVLGVSFFAKKAIGYPWAWDLVQETMDQLRAHAFHEKYKYAPHHRHRATLFERRKTYCLFKPWRWRKGRWPWSGWAVPIARSKDFTKNIGTVFFAPNDAHKAEGIAGCQWDCDGYLQPREQLPDLNQTYTDQAIREYADLSLVSKEFVEERIRAGKPMYLALKGFPIYTGRTVSAVVVLDSMEPDGIKDDKSLYDIVEYTQTVLGTLVPHI